MQENRPDRERTKSRGRVASPHWLAAIRRVESKNYGNHMCFQIGFEIAHMPTRRQLRRPNPDLKLGPTHP